MSAIIDSADSSIMDTFNLQQTAALLLDEPGSLAYFLVLSMSLMMIFSLSRIQHGKAAQRPERWVLASSILLTVLMLLILITWLAWMGWIDQKLLPSLNRFASLFGLITLTTGLVLRNDRTFRRSILLAAVVCGMILTLSLIASFQMDTLVTFNDTWVDAVWSFAGLAASVSLAIGIILTRRERWPLTLVPVMLIMGGYGLHLSSGSAFASLAAFVRLAEICAYPLFTVLISRSLAAPPSERPGELRAEHTPPAWSGLLNAISSLHTASNEEFHMDLIVDMARTLTDSFQADICLILTAPGQNSHFAVAAGYNRIQKHQISESSLTPGEAPVIHQAMVSKKSFLLEDAQTIADTSSLEKKMRRALPGPILFSPFHVDSQIFGGALLLAPVRKTSWTIEDQHNLEILSGLTADRLKRLTDRNKSDPFSANKLAEIEEDMEMLRQILENASDTTRDLAEKREYLLEKYRSSRIELDRMQEGLAELQAELQATRKELSETTESYQLLEEEHDRATARLQELQSGREAYEQARHQLQQVKTEYDQLQQSLETAAKQRQQIEEKHEQLHHEYQAARKLVRELEAQTAQLKAQLAETEAEAEQKRQELSTMLKLVLQELADTRSNLSVLQREQNADKDVLNGYADLLQDLEKPISSMQGYTKLLMGESVGMLSTMQRRFMERIHASLEEISGALTGETIEPQPEGEQPAEQGADLVQSLEFAAGNLQEQITARSLTFDFQLPGTIPRISCPAEGLETMLQAVLEKAIHTAEGSGSLSIRAVLPSDNQRGRVLLSISDEEKTAGDQGRDQFSPSNGNVNDPAYESLTRVCEQFGGKFWVESSEGNTYSLLLPTAV